MWWKKNTDLPPPPDRGWGGHEMLLYLLRGLVQLQVKREDTLDFTGLVAETKSIHKENNSVSVCVCASLSALVSEGGARRSMLDLLRKCVSL